MNSVIGFEYSLFQASIHTGAQEHPKTENTLICKHNSRINLPNQPQHPVSQEPDTDIELCFDDRYRGLEECINTK